MEYVIKGYKPEKLFNFFEEIAWIPRASGEEKAIADYMVRFAEERRLEVYRDEHHNVLIKKPATPGYENCAPVMIQAHLDMVCEKLPESTHDFSKDPIKLIEKDGILSADGTTLGADDGTGLSIILCALDSKDICHPPLECLMTSVEEAGMIGAKNFDYSKVSAKNIINIDVSTHTDAIVGCGASERLFAKYKYTKLPFSGECVKLTVTGLLGGHSGGCVMFKRANANMLMARALAYISSKKKMNLVSFNGGFKMNAITRESSAVIAVDNAEDIASVLKEFRAVIDKELIPDEKILTFNSEKISDADYMMSDDDTYRIISFMNLAPNNLITLSAQQTNPFPELSSNLGIVETDSEYFRVVSFARSAVNSRLDQLEDQYTRLAKAFGFEIEIEERSSGWEYQENNPLLELFFSAFRELVPGCSCTPKVTHAGLECGIISGALGGNCNAISIGPRGNGAHTVREYLDLKSLEMIWCAVCKVLANLK